MITTKEQKKAGGQNYRNHLPYFGTGRFRGGVLPAMLSSFIWILLLLSLPAMHVCAEEGYDEVAGSTSMGKTKENLTPYGMTPVSGNMIKDGEYIVGTECSSSFFHIEEARLTRKLP